MKNKFLLFLMLGITLFAACNDDDDPEVPPTLSEIAGNYSGEKLVATINSAAAGETAAVQLSRVSDTTAKLVLQNIVPNHESFEISKAKFESLSRSNFYSRLTGEATSEAGDLKVAATAEIADGVMTLTVTTTEIDITNPLYGTSYTGDMSITVSMVGQASEPIVAEQTVFINAPTNEEDNFMNLQIKEFSFSGMSLGDINLENIELTEEENGYSFTISDYTLNIPDLASIGTITANASGTITDETTLALTLQIQAGAVISVAVDFEGTKNEE